MAPAGHRRGKHPHTQEGILLMPRKTDETEEQAQGLSRRQFLRGVGAAGAGTALATELLHAEAAEAEPKPLAQPPKGKTLKRGSQTITLNVNGQAMNMEVEPRTTLL